MPLNTVRHSIHIRRKKNERVFNNIARLWDIARKAQSHQNILDALHPWNAPIVLKFENVLPLLLAAVGLFFVLLIFLNPGNIWVQICLVTGLFMIFWAYISFEERKPIDEVIEYLEQQSIGKKYNLAFQQPPQHLSIPVQPVLFIAHLKRLFPVFNQGSIVNEIYNYASTIWTDEDGKQHQVMVFQYHFVNEIRVRNKNGEEVQVKEIHRDLWGVFVFDVAIQGLAVTTANKEFDYPYSFPWHTSDIQINQKLNIFGNDEMHMAKLLTPAFVLKLDQFFAQRQGDLMFHPDSQLLCFLGPANLFQISSRAKKIHDISALRGHLRTFKLPYLESLARDLTQFLK
ncbi:hypothetical protein [Acinetobacter bouvetii]|uniref:DUF3137 domain-containing protein n=1 Tax=Acinetobacter bouvetii TaxID=202951 RepID=A0A811GCS0_9GAMM|nr:hypothetical protein [Acinetobacter bouvetii]CAB1217457.1 hypothetical protein SFB21_2100 [Acinetobacter bouvetii]